MVDAGQNIISRCLPKTGAHADPVYRAGDDDSYQAGWWRGRTLANNRERFLLREMTGGAVVVIDRATKLMWANIPQEAGCNNDNPIDWADAIDYAEGLD